VKHLKRKRKSNYSVRETQTLIREIHKRRDVLFSRQQNTAINELKRQAWEEVARGVNSLGEGELRTAAEVKRRYLDWRSLMKRKQLQAELSLSSSSSSSLILKSEYEPSSPEAASLTSACDQLLDLSGLPKDCHCDWPELALGDPSSQTLMPPLGVKIEEDSRGDGHLPEVYSNSDLGLLSSSKGPTSTTNRDVCLTNGLLGYALQGSNALSNDSVGPGGLLVAVEKQRLELEKQRLAVESERLAVEKERLAVEKERLRQSNTERERLQLEKERLQVERERLRLMLINQSEHEGRGWLSLRLQFFKFESGRLQIERERLQVEKERMQLHIDHQSH
uniref:Myb/SANT-like DNA-binding domain-containing protein 4 n=1 Tax=Neogobius melanostomus TaxID=47308 RepID=A0A8C6TUN0_9GOBI